MKIGVPKEIKVHEYRVGMTPAQVKELTKLNHVVYIENNAGEAINFTNEDYIKAGGVILNSAKEVFTISDMIIKVKEPQPEECKMLKKGQILFTYLHLAPDPQQVQLLLESECIAIAYETVTDNNNKLPLLAPMSEVAGRLSIQAGSYALLKHNGGKGILLGGVPGVAPSKVVILGGGVVGQNAARMAMGLNADTVIIDRNIDLLKHIDNTFNGRIKTLYSNSFNIEEAIKDADLIVGAVLIPGAMSPKLITRDMLKLLKKGTVLVDVSIDQGGCFETSTPTTHENPIYVVDDILHYCVANMPGATAKTSTLALTNATTPFITELANKNWQEALQDNIHLQNGMNICLGNVTYNAVANDLGYKFTHPKAFI